MNSHIPCLNELLVLAALAFPASLNALVPGAKKLKLAGSMALNAGIYVVLLAMAALALGGGFPVPRLGAALALYALAPLAGLLAVGVEYALGALVVLVRTGSMAKRASAHSYYRSGAWALDLPLIVALAFLEELVFRQVFVTVFLDSFGIAVAPAVLACGAVYALNHSYFGRDVVMQKFLSGILYCTLFVLSGRDVLVVALAHIGQNVSVYLLSRRGGQA